MKPYKFLLTLTLMLLTASCSTTSNTQPPNQQALEKITVVLDYLPNTNHTGLYIAKELGYYEEAGLDVSIIEPAEGVTNTLIATGKGDFGISFQEDVTYALSSAQPLPITAIAAILQHNTSGFASFAEKNITSPADYTGKVYSGWGSPAEEAIIRSVVNSAGGDGESVRIFSGGGDDFSAMQGNVDLTWIYYGWTGINAEIENFPLNFQSLIEMDSRLDCYTPVIITSSKMIKEQPETIRAFLTATEKGYQSAISDPQAAAEILAKFAPEYDIEFLRRSQEYLSPLYIDDAPRWGEMQQSRWQAYTDFMLENSLITSPPELSTAFTNEFLP